jgi:hypothetical protein
MLRANTWRTSQKSIVPRCYATVQLFSRSKHSSDLIPPDRRSWQNSIQHRLHLLTTYSVSKKVYTRLFQQKRPASLTGWRAADVMSDGVLARDCAWAVAEKIIVAEQISSTHRTPPTIDHSPPLATPYVHVVQFLAFSSGAGTSCSRFRVRCVIMVTGTEKAWKRKLE